MQVFIEGIGLCGPGLAGWAASRKVLAGREAYQAAPVRVTPSTLLPANERRRAVATVKLALAAGAEAFAAAGRDPAATATVFASSGGDGETIDQILNALASPRRELSPTRFHNSVHNAPSGYWSIATGARAASTSLCCHDDSFAAGVLEAGVQVVTGRCAVALVAYDVQYPAPLSLARPIGAAFAMALVLAPERGEAAIAELEIALGPAKAATRSASLALEALRQNTPAARALTLLEVLARAEAAEVTLEYLEDMALTLHVLPAA
jgi:hypothetical protein